jgi:hypothetical protein
MNRRGLLRALRRAAIGLAGLMLAALVIAWVHYPSTYLWRTLTLLD